MAAQLIDGKALAAEIRTQTADKVAQLKAAGHQPKLAALLATDDDGAKMYAESQRSKCEDLGIDYQLEILPGDSDQTAVLAAVAKLNDDDSVDGIIVQQPLPDGVDEGTVQAAVRADKDVEGASPLSLGLLTYGQPALLPCTALAAWELIKSTGIEVSGAEAVVIGRSPIVGRPLGLILLANHATVTWCHTRTRDMAAVARRADILCVAAGRPGLVGADFVKEGATVIDVGTNRVEVTDADGNRKRKTVGDVDFDAVAPKAGRITPVPGGVGPVTVALLLRNVAEAAEHHAG